jgi:hypothetical protein
MKGEGEMKCIIISAAVLITMAMAFPAGAAGPREDTFREAYRQILSQVDVNKDGKLAVAECTIIYKDKKMAEKNCTFWDIDKNGIITETEYVQQGSNLGKRK